MAREKPIGYGIIGVGIWGQLHARVLSESAEKVHLVAVCDLDGERARQVADQYHIPRVYTSYQELLQNPEVEAVSVATPDFAHGPPALAVLQAGRHLLVDKPMATTVAECLQILKAAKEARVTLMVDFHNRWSPAFYTARQTIRSGEIGELKYIYFRLNDTIYVPTRYISWAARSSVLWFLGPHAVDTLRWLFDDEVSKVYAVRRSGVLSGQGIDTPDFYSIILQFERGGVAHLEHSWIVAASTPSLFDLKCELQGAKGTLYIDTSSNRSLEVYSERTPQGYPFQPYVDTTLMPVIHGNQVGFGAQSIRHFADCLWSGSQPLATGLDGLRATEILTSIERSAQLDQPVAVEKHPFEM